MGGYSHHGAVVYNAADATAAGVPEGYNDNVLEITSNSAGATGVVLDFTSWNIKATDIVSITIRYYVDSACGSIRIPCNGTWLFNDPNIDKEQWAEITINTAAVPFVNYANADGTLGYFPLAFRHGTTFYVDSITVNMA